jgi:hypothetical protein
VAQDGLSSSQKNNLETYPRIIKGLKINSNDNNSNGSGKGVKKRNSDSQ